LGDKNSSWCATDITLDGIRVATRR